MDEPRRTAAGGVWTQSRVRVGAAGPWLAAGEEGSHWRPRRDRSLDPMSNRKRLSIVEHLIGWCFGKHLFDADDGKKQPSKTRRPEAQLGTCCHCTGRKLQRLNFRLGEGRTDGLKRHFYLRGPFNLPGGKMSILLLPFQYSKHIHYSFSSYKVKTWMLVSRCS